MLYDTTTKPALAWAFSQRIAGNAKLVLLKIAFAADDEGKCLLTTGELASAATATTTNVRRVVRELQGLGLIRVEKISRTESAYYLLFA